MAGIPNSENSDENERKCEKQVEKEPDSSETNSGNDKQTGKYHIVNFILQIDRSADVTAKIVCIFVKLCIILCQ